MACERCSRLCPNLIFSQSVTFSGGNVVVNIPAGSYNNGKEYCIVITQAIPTTATIDSPVVITIGDGAELYPLQSKCGAPITVCGIGTYMRYPVTVVTNATSGVFRLLCKPVPYATNNLTAINGTAPTA